MDWEANSKLFAVGEYIEKKQSGPAGKRTDSLTCGSFCWYKEKAVSLRLERDGLKQLKQTDRNQMPSRSL